MTRTLILAALFTAVAGSALAAPVTLRADIADDDGRVTLGEVFDGAGGAARVVVATGRPGTSILIEASTLQRVAMANNLSWANERGLRRVVVRPGAASAGPGVRGVEALTYVRSLNAGEMVGPEDLAWTKVVGAPVDAPRDADAVIGMVAKRPLRAGAAVARRDVSAPLVIQKDEVIAVTYSFGGVSLALQGKAVKGAAAGDTLDVVNPASKKIIQAVAIGPGRAVVGPNAAAFKSVNLASR